MKKKKTISFIAVFVFVVVAVLNIQLGLNKDGVSQGFKLNNIESLSACEGSSNPDNNNGYCIRIYGGDGDACVKDGWEGYHVRCSGNS